MKSEEAIYLIESKWTVKRNSNTIVLKENQRRRHEMMRWFIENWSGEEWDKFKQKYSEDFQNGFEVGLPGSGSLLSRNLMHILGIIKNDAFNTLPVVDVVCFFLKKGSEEPRLENQGPFRLVILDYPSVGANDFIELR